MAAAHFEASAPKDTLHFSYALVASINATSANELDRIFESIDNALLHRESSREWFSRFSVFLAESVPNVAPDLIRELHLILSSRGLLSEVQSPIPPLSLRCTPHQHLHRGRAYSVVLFST